MSDKIKVGDRVAWNSSGDLAAREPGALRKL